MCVTGKPLKAPDALAAGLIDEILHGDLTAGAVTFARAKAERRGLAKTRDRDDRLGSPGGQRSPLRGRARDGGRTRRHQLAPLKAVDAIEAAATLPFDAGCRRERELFVECVQSEQAKALVHLFFAERAVTKVPGVGKETPVTPVNRVAIVGAGTMGGGIAMACVNAGLSVVLKETSPSALDAGLATIRKNYDVSVKRGRFTPAQVEERLARIQPQLGYDGFETADLVIEAVFESLDLKRRIFAELDGVTKPDAVLGTNTSTLDIDVIARATSRPASVIGLHFFSPANVMRLLEIVRGHETSAAHDRDRVCGRQAARQGGRPRRQLPRIHRQPDDVPLHVRDAVPRRRGRHARTGRSRAHRLRNGDGHVRRR